LIKKCIFAAVTRAENVLGSRNFGNTPGVSGKRGTAQQENDNKTIEETLNE